MILEGKSIAPGIACGVTHLIDARAILRAALLAVPLGAPQAEFERLQAAIGRAGVELDRVQRRLTGRLTAEDVAIFESHAGLLRDPQFMGRVEHEIRQNGQSAEAAVARVVNELFATFSSAPVPLLSDKAADVLDIGRRLVACLSVTEDSDVLPGEGAVIVAASLTPSQLVRYAHLGAVAAVVESCGPRSHTAILARGLGLPLVSGIESIDDLIPDGVEAAVDGAAGRVIVAPTAEEEALFDQAQARRQSQVTEELVSPEPPVTLDGVRVRLLLNISDEREALAVPLLGADGVGLFRTEFQYMDRTGWPDEDACFESYRSVAEKLGTAELSIRLVDFGADKCPPYADFPSSRNPSLGLRGIRLLLQREDILTPQVRALARLAQVRPVTVLIPMLDSLDTLAAATGRICQAARCGAREQLPFRLGAMIEVPAVAYQIEALLPHVDSVAIGLNDLTQYLLAADRDDEFVERYHDAMQPAVLRLVHAVIAACHAHGRPVTVCGELAGDPRLTGLFLALGLRRFSVSRVSYRPLVDVLRHLSLRSMEGLAAPLLALNTAAEVRRFAAEKFSPPA